MVETTYPMLGTSLPRGGKPAHANWSYAEPATQVSKDESSRALPTVSVASSSHSAAEREPTAVPRTSGCSTPVRRIP